jgi:thioredoxin 1
MKRGILLITVFSLVLVSLLTVAYTFKQDEPKIISLTEYNKRVEDKTKTTLVYFHADWCAVCRKMQPVIDKLDTIYKPNLEIFRIDTERDKEVAEHFEVSSLPILILYHKGDQAWIHVGLISENDLKKKLSDYVATP